jgi:hypothetical protein
MIGKGGKTIINKNTTPRTLIIKVILTAEKQMKLRL